MKKQIIDDRNITIVNGSPRDLVQMTKTNNEKIDFD
jgi:hypothetical protein